MSGLLCDSDHLLLPDRPARRVHTGVMEAEPYARSRRTWRPWSIWLPGTLALAWSGLLIIADGLAGVMGSWDTPPPGLYRWIRVGVAGHCVLMAASALVLAAGVRFPSPRRAAAITAWIIIPVGFGYQGVKNLEENAPEPGESFEKIRDFLLRLWDEWPRLHSAMRVDLGVEDLC